MPRRFSMTRFPCPDVFPVGQPLVVALPPVQTQKLSLLRRTWLPEAEMASAPVESTIICEEFVSSKPKATCGVEAPPSTTESLRHGLVVPTPTLPEKFAAAAVMVPVNVGLAENTTLPVPVSSESHCEKCCEAEKSEEVAVSTQALPSYSKRSPYAAAVMVVSVRESRSVTLLPPMQVPLIDTHPPVRLMPLANVLVADVPLILRYVEARAPENVEVELVPATFRMPWMVEVPVVLLWRVEVAAVPEVLPTYSLSKMERREVEALPKTLSPVNVLLFARSVEEAAVMVMSALPLKEVPLMLRAVARTVAAPAVREAAVPGMLGPAKAEGVPRAGVTR